MRYLRATVPSPPRYRSYEKIDLGSVAGGTGRGIKREARAACTKATVDNVAGQILNGAARGSAAIRYLRLLLTPGS